MHRSSSSLLWNVVVATLALSVGLVMLMPDEAAAQQLHLEADGTVLYTQAPSFRVISGMSDASNGRVTVGYALGEDVVPGLRTYLTYGGGRRSTDRLGGDLSFSWNRNLVLTGLGWGYDIREFVRPYLRTLFGYAHQRLGVQTPSADYQQHVHDFAVVTSGGVELYFPYLEEGEDVLESPGFSSHVTLGIDAEGGYLWQTPARYNDLQQTSDDWNRRGADIGVLNVNGIFWSLGLFMRIRL